MLTGCCTTPGVPLRGSSADGGPCGHTQLHNLLHKTWEVTFLLTDFFFHLKKGGDGGTLWGSVSDCQQDQDSRTVELKQVVRATPVGF